MAGWIKLHRKMLEWEWYEDTNTKVLYLHILLSANHKEKSWQGVKIEKGSFITGLESLSKKTGLSVRQVRTSLNKLISTGEVTSKSTNRFRIISVPNWNTYQEDDRLDDSQPTSERQTDDKQSTATNNDNNDKEVKELDITPAKEKSKSGRNLKGYDFSSWPEQPSDDVLDDFKKTRKTRLTQTAITRMAKEIQKGHEAGLTPDDCLAYCCETGWQAFKYDYYLNREKKNGNSRQNSEGLTGAAKRAQDFHDDLKRYAEGGAAAVMGRKDIR